MRDAAEKKTRKKVALMENGYFVFILSFLLAVVAWLLVSMSQTNEVEKDFTNVKVQLNVEGSLPANNNLTMFGNEDYYVDVSVRGKSYLVNDAAFADRISVTASLSSVTAAGTYSLPIVATINGLTDNDVTITRLSRTAVSVYFDEKTEKTFPLTEEVLEGGNYKLADGYNIENPRLSVENVTLTGPALQINRIASVKAVVTLDKEISATENLKAEIVPVGTTDGVGFDYVTLVNDAPIYVTIPVTFTSEYRPVISFTNQPKTLRDGGMKYTVSPDKVRVSVPANDKALIDSEELTVGTVDFSRINNEVNTIEVSVADSQYTFADGVSKFTVTVDMSDMDKRWMEVPVSADGVKLPENAKIVSSSVESVQIIGPTDSVMKIDSSEAYAVPVLDGVTLQSGTNTVPAKIVLRTLTDSWVRGSYTIDIRVD